MHVSFSNRLQLFVCELKGKHFLDCVCLCYNQTGKLGLPKRVKAIVQKDPSKESDRSYCNIQGDTVHVNKQLFISPFILAVQFEQSWVKKTSEFTNNFKRHS